MLILTELLSDMSIATEAGPGGTAPVDLNWLTVRQLDQTNQIKPKFGLFKLN